MEAPAQSVPPRTMTAPAEAVRRSRRLADAAALDATLAARLKAFAHPRVAPIVEAAVVDGALATVEPRIAGEPLPPPGAVGFTDKALAIGADLAPILHALDQAGLAHGDLGRDAVLWTDDGFVLVGVTGLRPDGSPATSADDVRALAELMAQLLSASAPANIRSGLARIAAEPPPAAALPGAINALRAAIPIAPGRQVRSIQRLAFPPPPKKPKRGKRYLARIILIATLVGLGLMAAMSASGIDIAKSPGAPATSPKDRPGVVFIHTTPLPKPKPAP
ncbi:MAG: hypothetical protein U1F43_07970 [Myxococcota bacterium]